MADIFRKTLHCQTGETQGLGTALRYQLCDGLALIGGARE